MKKIAIFLLAVLYGFICATLLNTWWTGLIAFVFALAYLSLTDRISEPHNKE